MFIGVLGIFGIFGVLGFRVWGFRGLGFKVFLGFRVEGALQWFKGLGYKGLRVPLSWILSTYRGAF